MQLSPWQCSCEVIINQIIKQFENGFGTEIGFIQGKFDVINTHSILHPIYNYVFVLLQLVTKYFIPTLKSEIFDPMTIICRLLNLSIFVEIFIYLDVRISAFLVQCNAIQLHKSAFIYLFISLFTLTINHSKTKDSGLN